MVHLTLTKSHKEEIVELFAASFSDAQGEKEGALIGKLVSELASSIDNRDIICFGARENEALIGSIFFTRLTFNEPAQVYMLAPVAVSTAQHGKGVATDLITYGLKELKQRSVSLAITYGDPAFYSRVGFQPLSERVIQAPLKMSMPEGWQGQSLSGEPIPVIGERPTCVEAFDDPAYW